MKVIGQLERAQLENAPLSSLPGPASSGRIFLDTTTPTAPVPRVYLNGAWYALATTQPTPFIPNTPTSNAVVVNWATGLYQQVTLNSHTSISFINPQPGQVHVLAITQRATENVGTTPWMYTFNIPDQYARRLPLINRGVLQSSETALYAWFYSAGIKPAYATVPSPPPVQATNPATLMTGIDIYPGQGQGFSPGEYNTIIGGRTSSPFMESIRAYDGGSHMFWQKNDITTPTAAAAQVLGVAYHPDGHSLFAVSGTTPFIQAWGVDIYGIPNQNAYANPATLPAGSGQCIAVHPSGSHVIVGHATTPFISCYPINGGAFGLKLTNPATLPASAGNTVSWAPTGDYLLVGTTTTPFIQVYPFDPGSGFGALCANPVTLPVSGAPASPFFVGKGSSWHPSGNYVAMCTIGSPYFCFYPFNRTLGTFGAQVVPAGANIPGEQAICCQFSPCGNFLAVGTSGNLYVYNIAGTNITAPVKLAFDGGAPGQQVNDIVWRADGEFIFVAYNGSPFVAAWPAPRAVKNYMKLTY